MERAMRIVAALTTAGTLACGGINGDAGNVRDPNGPEIETPPGSGYIEVTVATANPVSDAPYTVTISNGQKQTAAPNATLSFTTHRTGTHEVSLSSVPVACTVGGSNPISVNVRGGEHVNVGFTVNCGGGNPPNVDRR